MARYGMEVKIHGDMEWVKSRLVEALKAQGFGVLTEIDVQKTLKQKIGVDFKPYHILGACNPRFAYQALSADEDIGLLLPCNIVLRQERDGIEVCIQDPEVMFAVVDEGTKKNMAGFPQEVKRSLLAALETLKKSD
ncbi:MAG: DUF302 domain-containing protein [Acidobacteriaceae bacterium]